ncbi:uncharacterized protein ARMOST_06413 [Armillaria ostoyae]|uniref:Uncharacterized protein n=1 Tax=Armillaria ostoyae TaxID=47428 RepID=A0A284R2Z9_ARMOS|nr:uncharacterized protein ARMOST_06413 [Armillaria ostoyae]
MSAPHSYTPSNSSLWAFQEDIGYNVRVDVDMMSPEPSLRREEGLTEESQCRKYDTFFGKDVFDGAKEKLGRYLEELPSEKDGWGTTDGPMRDAACNCGRSVRRLVTGIPSRLLKTYSPFRLYAHTPCLSIHDTVLPAVISAPNTSSRYQWLDVLPPYDEWLGTQSFVLFPGASEERWDYLTQQPPNPATLGEKNLCLVAASRLGPRPSLTLWDRIFGKWWGGESYDEKYDLFERGRAKKAWSGVLGISADALPWVRNVLSKVSRRSPEREWIVAGYLGEGMVHAWMSGKALAYTVLEKDVDWLPTPFRVTEKDYASELSEQSISLITTYSRYLSLSSIIDVHHGLLDPRISAYRPAVQLLFTCLASHPSYFENMSDEFILGKFELSSPLLDEVSSSSQVYPWLSDTEIRFVERARVI